MRSSSFSHVVLQSIESYVFENRIPGLPDRLEKFAHEDVIASSIRMGLIIAGPVGAIVGEFLTHFVPAHLTAPMGRITAQPSIYKLSTPRITRRLGLSAE